MDKVVGILGGGQLGRMTVEAANRLNIKTVILDADGCPAKQINSGEHLTGKFTDAAKVKELAGKSDVVTIEIEHINVDALDQVSNDVIVAPSPKTIALIQDKYLQKEHLQKHGVAVAVSSAVESSVEALGAFGSTYGYPFMLKSRRDAYDGRGNFVVKSQGHLSEALAALPDRALYAEQWAPFTKELAVMVLRSHDNQVYSYPTVETVHEDNICHLVFAPAQVPRATFDAAQELARRAVATFEGAGIFGVEMFLLPSGELLINEIAPRPHNSGHYTQEACVTTQFEAHIRAVAGLPLPEGFANFSTSTTNAVMLNLLGQNGEEDNLVRRALETPGCAVHLYGKESRPKRKIGHINIVADSMPECLAKLAIVQGSKAAATEAASIPQVGVIMGSDSDLPVMKAACNVLKDFGVPFEVSIVSAHRTPAKMVEYAESAESRGLSVIIAGAGGAAHLPGMVAASTVVPVIGVPVKGSSLDGVDSLYSICQMPRGVPVATVAINNAMNAGLLAVRMLGSSNKTLRDKLRDFAAKSSAEVHAKDAHLRTVGHEEYKWN